jgi:hypothetical protein
MRPTSTRISSAVNVRETLHELSNALAGARMWLLVLDDTTSQRTADLPLTDARLRLSLCLGNGEQCCERLRQLLSETPRAGAVSEDGPLSERRRVPPARLR